MWLSANKTGHDLALAATEKTNGGIPTKSHGSRCSLLFADVPGSRGREMWGRKARQVSRAKVLGLCNKEEH